MSDHPGDGATFTKSDRHVPSGFFAAEAAGLRWLGDAGGAPVARVVDVSETALVLERLHADRPQRGHGVELGQGLARTHRAGADAFGASAPGAERYFFGPLNHPLELPVETSDRFGAFYAGARLDPVTTWCRQEGAIGAALADGVARVCSDLREGRWDRGDDGEPVRPARLHGDLWAGNVMWTPHGAVLIDPAACGGHPEADPAMLELFGAPHLDAIIEGYAAVAPLGSGRRDRIPLHQLFPLLVHALLFGGGYAASVRRAVEALID